ncbi:MAG: Mur ligase family protein [Candidatus Paceibacterota bacterium]|jgi:UDP-N-acetylmuramoyl-L-alanyl-D-glutamate--2,6-diaminopimelate ligase
MIKRLFFFYHYLWSFFGALIFRFPSRRIKVFGITGTKGKTTTVALLSYIFNKAKIKNSALSSVWRKVGDKQERNLTGNSMPGRFLMQGFLNEAAKNSCSYAFVEVTSQGIVQSRHRFIDWDGAVFLDIHPEHIESHGSFENYLKAKVSFFEHIAKKTSKNPVFFINKKDLHWEEFADASKAFTTKLFSSDDVNDFGISQNLGGDFNKINIAAAVAIAREEKISEDIIRNAVKDFEGVIGRVEFVQKEPFSVVVDYAHTPDSLEEIYKFLSGYKKSDKKLICVLGSAGGGRDKWKRPKMGEMAAKYCDSIILTNEDPYDEQPENIINEIESGCSQIQNSKFEILKITNRKEAIKKAISLAKEGDVVVCTGKGSETSIHIDGGKIISWSERDVVKEILK